MSSTDPDAIVYQESHPATPVQDGVFHIVIGQGATPSGTFDESLFSGPDFISFTDFSFSTADNVALVTPVVTVPGNPVFADISSNGGRLVVQIRLDQAEGFPGPFMFVVWD